MALIEMWHAPNTHTCTQHPHQHSHPHLHPTHANGTTRYPIPPVAELNGAYAFSDWSMTTPPASTFAVPANCNNAEVSVLWLFDLCTTLSWSLRLHVCCEHNCSLYAYLSASIPPPHHTIGQTSKDGIPAVFGALTAATGAISTLRVAP